MLTLEEYKEMDKIKLKQLRGNKMAKSVGKFSVEVIKGPDDMGKYIYFLNWETDYTPSKPYPHTKSQIFHCVPPPEIMELIKNKLREKLK